MNRLPTNEERFEALRGYLQTLSLVKTLRAFLGNKKELDSIPSIARPLIKYSKVICIDTESHTANTDDLTEVGVVKIQYNQAGSLKNGPGEHGLFMLQQLRFLHFRVVENAHLVLNPEGSSGPEGNLYGKTRFVTFLELRTVLDHMLNKRITGNEELEGCPEPILLVGHAIQHDIDNFKKSGLQFDIAQQRSIVARVDTQLLAREVGLENPHSKTPQEKAANTIALKDLTEAIGFKHEQQHTACNDASRAIICAINMVLDEQQRKPKDATMTMQDVVKLIEGSSTEQPAPYGTVECCTRCSNRSHSNDTCEEVVSCDACTIFDRTEPTSHTEAHTDIYCPHITAFKAGMRRVVHASKRNKDVQETFFTQLQSGPGATAHPWKTWPKEQWPSDDPFRVIAGLSSYPEPLAKLRNLKEALGSCSVPSEGEWLMRDGSVRAAPAEAPWTTVVRGRGSGATRGRGDPPSRGLGPLRGGVTGARGGSGGGGGRGGGGRGGST